ncbi:MAG: hypothetical protein ACP5VS_12105 [Desulfomonilaceae bacterium]
MPEEEDRPVVDKFYMWLRLVLVDIYKLSSAPVAVQQGWSDNTLLVGMACKAGWLGDLRSFAGPEVHMSLEPIRRGLAAACMNGTS